MLPEEVANRSFRSALRGVSESDVRSFLRRVADELTRMRADEQALRDRIAELEARSNAPVQLSEQQLLDALGEETAKVLRSAQDAADEIRTKAEERAALVRREAQDDARRLREDADQAMSTRIADAEAEVVSIRDAADAKATAMVADAETRAETIRSDAERDADLIRERAARAAEAHLEDARTSGRELVGEARAVRERIVTDLVTRRTLLQEQIEELRKGRESLLGAYKVVKATLDQATQALLEVETRAAAELVTESADSALAGLSGLPDGPDKPVFYDQDAAIAAEDALDLALAEVAAALPTPAEVETVIELAVEEATIDVEVPSAPSEDAPSVEADAAASTAEASEAGEVDALFAKLRAARSDAVDEARAVLDSDDVSTLSSGAEMQANSEGEAVAADAAVGATEMVEVETVAVTTPRIGDANAELDDAVRLTQRNAIDSAAPTVSRKIKRVLQDEQNELLDALRTAKRTPASATVLPDRAARVVAWSAAIASGIATAYAAGWESAGTAAVVPDHAPASLVEEAVDAVLSPWRERLADAIDAAGDDDVVTRVGARFREFRAQQLESTARELLALAYARGVYDAAPEDAVLRWIPIEVGQCPDCDDNALEAVRKGTPFPTGQVFPPAHPGCRCALATTLVGVALR